MKRKPKNGLKKPKDSVVFDTPEMSVKCMKAKLACLLRALETSTRSTGPVSAYWDGDSLVIPREELMKCLFGPNWEDFR